MGKRHSGKIKAAGILLIAYILIYTIEYLEFNQGILVIVGLISYLMILAAGITLFINNLKLAMAFMISGAFLNLVTLYTEGARVVNSGAFYNIPDIYTLIPVLIWLSILFYAIVLFSNGHTAWIPAAISACSQIAAMILQFNEFQYITGHPSPFNLIIPAEFVISVMLAAGYVSTLERHTLFQKLVKIFTVKKGMIVSRTLSQNTIDTICGSPVETMAFMYYPEMQNVGKKIELTYIHNGTAGGRNSFAPDVKMIINSLENNTLFELIMSPKKPVAYFLAAWVSISLILQLILFYTIMITKDSIAAESFSPMLLGVAGTIVSIVFYYLSVYYYNKQFRSALLKILKDPD